LPPQLPKRFAVARSVSPGTFLFLGFHALACNGGAVRNAANAAEPTAEPVVETARAVVEPVAAAAEPALEPVVEAAAPAVRSAANAAEPALEPVVRAVEPAVEPVTDATKPLLDPVVEAAEPVAAPVRDVAQPVTDLLTGSSHDDEPSAASQAKTGPSKEKSGDEPAMSSVGSESKKPASGGLGRTAAAVLDTLHAA